MPSHSAGPVSHGLWVWDLEDCLLGPTCNPPGYMWLSVRIITGGIVTLTLAAAARLTYSRRTQSVLTSKYLSGGATVVPAAGVVAEKRAYSHTALLGRRGGNGDGGMPRGVKKENLPQKVCIVCNRPFTWRKKWERCWDEVSTCSKSCNAKRRAAKHDADSEGQGAASSL